MVDPTLLAPHLVSTLLGSKLRETGRRCLQLSTGPVEPGRLVSFWQFQVDIMAFQLVITL